MSEPASRTEDHAPSVDRLALLWRRLKDHRIAQWTVGYVAVAYGIQHAVTLTSEAYEWPNIIARVSMTLLALGLPIAMTLAWYHGGKANHRISGPELSILSVLLIGVSILFYAFVRPTETRAPVQDASVTAARTAAANPRLGIAVAVMPFANISGDKDQEYFSDGMTDELSGALAKIPDLSVVARSSAFQFKGKNQDARTIGQQLHATHLIEGSVRKAGDQLRISAELVKAEDGVTVWSNSYDRQLKDVFAVQEDIARAIASSLHMMLGLKPGEDLVNQRQIDTALHDQYLRAKNLGRSRLPESTAEGIRLLNDVVTRNPRYAPVWTALAFAYEGSLLISPEVGLGLVEQAKPIVLDLISKIEAAAGQAIKLDPNSAGAYCALSLVKSNGDRDYIAAVELWQRGLAIDADDPECLQIPELANLGFVQQLLPYREHLQALEPFVPAYRTLTARILFADGQTDASIAMLKDVNGAGLGPVLAQIYASQGRFRDAADALAAARRNYPAFGKNAAAVDRLLRAAPAVAAPEDRPELGASDWIYLYTGAPERFMNTYENQLRIGFFNGTPGVIEWAPAYHDIRQTARFKAWIRDAGIFTYWRAKGFPPQCHPAGGDDFVCD